jgi:hypothetical protein
MWITVRKRVKGVEWIMEKEKNGLTENQDIEHNTEYCMSKLHLQLKFVHEKSYP